MASVDERSPDRTLVVTRGGDVVNLNGLPPLDHTGGDPLALRDGRRTPRRLKQRRVTLICVMARPQPELRAWLVVLPDRAAGSTAELVGAGHDGLQDGFEIERGAEDAPDVTQCCQLVHRTGQLGSSLAQFVK